MMPQFRVSTSGIDGNAEVGVSVSMDVSADVGVGVKSVMMGDVVKCDIENDNVVENGIGE